MLVRQPSPVRGVVVVRTICVIPMTKTAKQAPATTPGFSVAYAMA